MGKKYQLSGFPYFSPGRNFAQIVIKCDYAIHDFD